MDAAFKPDLERPFLFKKEELIDKVNLRQGDLLENRGPLSDAIREAHPYYAEAEDYTHFMVISQSCDLVVRKGRPKANYITLAAVRPFDIVLKRMSEKSKFKDLKFPIHISDEAKRREIKFKLERFINNTVEDEGLFFISKHWHPALQENLCTFLQLSIALRPTHYAACLDCKVAELEDIFAAKVGWVTGNLYSRVATKDLSEEYDAKFSELFKSEFSKEILNDHPPFLYKSQMERLKQQVAEWHTANPEVTMTNEVAEKLLLQVPRFGELLAERMISVLIEGRFMDSTNEKRAITYLGNSKKFHAMIRELTGE